jgi:glycosyltransferase involved in cell wall biosynthesis
MEQVPRIRFPLEGFSHSGGMRVIITVANALHHAGMQVELAVPDYAAQPPFRLDSGVRLQVIGTPAALPHRGRQLWWFQWLARHAADQCDIVVATFWRTMYPVQVSRLSRRVRPRVVYMVQGDDARSQIIERPMNPLLRAILLPAARMTYRVPAHAVMVSSWLRESVGREGSVVANGVDRTVFFPAHQQGHAPPWVVGAVARPSAQKGWKPLLQMCGRLVERWGGDIRFIFTAPEPLPMDQIEPAVASKLTLVQPRSDEAMRSFYQSLHVFVFPSVSEGFGLPPLEAMACGTAVVSSDDAGTSEFISADNAVRVLGRDPEKLCAAVSELLQNHDERQRLIEGGLRTASTLTVQKQAERYVGFFRAVLTLQGA